MKQANALSPTGAATSVSYLSNPDLCPVCLHGVQPVAVGAQPVLCLEPGTASSLLLQLVFRCPRKTCGSVFIAQYRQNARSEYLLSRLIPQTVKKTNFDKAITKVSPTFIKIYDQSVAAESQALDEIAGAGFRRALEFLVKDYCISKAPERADEIKKIFLGACINNHVSDANVKACAKRAAWLGNDETHYVRVWDSHNIDDLKRLITLTVNWIVNEVLTEQYMSSMDEESGSSGKDAVSRDKTSEITK